MQQAPRIGFGLRGAGQKFVFTANFLEEGEFALDAFDPVLWRSFGKYVDQF